MGGFSDYSRGDGMSTEEISKLLQQALDLGNSVEIKIVPQNQLVKGPELEGILQIDHKTLKQWRDDYWVDGAHYFSQTNHMPRYNRELCVHWMKYHEADPDLHQTKVSQYLRSQSVK